MMKRYKDRYLATFPRTDDMSTCQVDPAWWLAHRPERQSPAELPPVGTADTGGVAATAVDLPLIIGGNAAQVWEVESFAFARAPVACEKRHASSWRPLHERPWLLKLEAFAGQ